MRPMSVRLPENQSTEQAPSMKVTNFTTLKVGLVEYGDERGRKVTRFAFITGDQVFVAPELEQWDVNRFKPLVKKLGEQVIGKLAALEGSASKDVPAQDEVDVTGPSLGDIP